MKKIIFICLAVALATTTILISCKKGSENETTKSEPAKHLARTIPGFNVDSTYKFLVFANMTDVQTLASQLVGKRHAEVREYLSTNGFISLGNTMFSNLPSDSLVTDQQAGCYLINSVGVIQVQNVLFKQVDYLDKDINDWNFFLTMTTDYLTSENYTLFSKGTYKHKLMNKFACGQDISGNFFDFINSTPVGYESPTKVPVAARRPFWGTVTTCGGCDGTGHQWCNHTHYIFWVYAGNDPTYAECTP